MFYRYESFTSDLKVWTEQSPLSEWTNTNIVKNLRFQIVFNRNQAKSAVIRGNQTQLESLISGLAIYVDGFLNSSNQTINQNFEFKLFHQVDIPNLGRFSRLEFSTLELFDLFTNLELLTSEIEILPALNLNPLLNLEFKPINPIWLKVAAVAIASVGVTVGITTATFKLLQPDSPQYVVTSNSIDSKSEQKSIKSDNSVNLAQPQIKPQAPQALGKDKNQVKSSITTRSPVQSPDQTSVQPPRATVQIPQTSPPIAKTPKIADQPSLTPSAITNPAIAQIPKILEQPPQDTVTDSSNLKTSGITGQSLPAPSNSAGVNARQEILETDQKNTNIGRATSKELLETPESSPIPNSARTRAMSKASERRDIDGFSSRVSRNEDANKNSQPQNLKLTVTKIESSADSQTLESFKNKLESFSLSPAKSSGLITGSINSELKILVRWRNRQIIEVRVIPESESIELIEFIRRSLFETFPDQDGNIEITLKVTAP